MDHAQHWAHVLDHVCTFHILYGYGPAETDAGGLLDFWYKQSLALSLESERPAAKTADADASLLH